MAHDTTGPTGRDYLKLVVVLGCLGALGPMTIDTYLPALPTLARQLDATDSQAQLTLSAMMMGLGLGQLFFGPLSDTFGRRRPLLIGLAGHAIASVICGLAPSIWVLLAGRALQGLCAAAVAVTSQAVIRDLFRGMKAAELLSRLALITGLAPILAPLVGSGLLTFTTWRGVFVILSLAACALIVLARRQLPETLPPQRRIAPNLGSTLAAYRRVLSDKLFIAVVMVGSLVFTSLFAYVSGSSFVMQDVFGLSPQVFGVAFATMSLGLSLASQLNPRLVRRVGPVRGLMVGLSVMSFGSLVMLALAWNQTFGLAGFLAPMFVVMGGLGISLPNGPAVALHRRGESAGTAAALLGAGQFAMGAIVTPLVGALADGTSRPIPLVMSIASLLGLAILVPVARRLRAESFD